MKKYITILVITLIVSACGRFANEDKKDDHTERIVCISKQYSEIIFALGAQENIVAVDLSSTYPPAIKTLPTVGYHRALSIEAILSMKPTLILHDDNIGPEHVVAQLNTLKIPMKRFAKHKGTIAGTDSLIREMGAYFHRAQRADSLCTKLNNDMQLALSNTNQHTDTTKVLVIHFGRASNIYLVMTKKSTAAQMITWAGGTMAVEDEKGMKQIAPEVVAQSNPDVILLTDFGYDRLGSTEKIKELPGIAATKAYQHKRIYRVEEHDLVYLGPRTGENILRLQKLIHQDAPAQ